MFEAGRPSTHPSFDQQIKPNTPSHTHTLKKTHTIINIPAQPKHGRPTNHLTPTQPQHTNTTGYDFGPFLFGPHRRPVNKAMLVGTVVGVKQQKRHGVCAYLWPSFVGWLVGR